MGSSFTPNLGIEQPATGMYANTWGNVANRSYAVIDAAIGGNAQIVISSPYTLGTGQGADPSTGVYPLIVWTGPQSVQGSVTFAPNTEQRLYIMSNQTTDQNGNIPGFPIAFQQGMGSQFVLQPGYDAQIYCDGAGANANVAATIRNPQFNNVLVQGDLTLNGSLVSPGGGISLGDVAIDTLGLGAPTSVPDPLTINGQGTGGQIRLVMNAGSHYGVILSNDGDNFYVMNTAAGTPYGFSVGTPAFWIDLDAGTVAVGGATPSASYGLTATSVYCAALTTPGVINCAQVLATGGVMVDSALTNNGAQLDLAFGAITEGIGSARVVGAVNLAGLTFFTAGQPRIYLTNDGRVGIDRLPDAGHALCVGGYIHAASGGIIFPDGSVQTTAVSGTFTQLTVNGNGSVSGTLSVGRLTGPSGCPAFSVVSTQNGMNVPNSSIGFSIDPLSELVVWYRDSGGTLWRAAVSFSTQWQQWTGPVQ